MLPKEHRLSRQEDILLVLRTGAAQRLLFLSVHYIHRQPSTRAVVVVGKKVSKKAVERNRVRRRLREALHSLIPELAPGTWVVVVARSGAEEKTQRELTQALASLIPHNE